VVFHHGSNFYHHDEKLKKKMSCLREMVAGNPAEEMPNGTAIKL